MATFEVLFVSERWEENQIEIICWMMTLKTIEQSIIIPPNPKFLVFRANLFFLYFPNTYTLYTTKSGFK